MADVVAEKVVDCLFGVAKKNIGYMWNCNKIVENLTREVDSLKVMKSQVEQQIGIAKDKGDNVIVGVEDWVEAADQEISKPQVFLGEFLNAKKTCFKIGMCGNWATLHRYGKAATEMMTPLKEHHEDGTNFVTSVSVETHPPTQLDVHQHKDLEDLATHKSALDAIIAALEDESKQIIGIYGLGGVGKTMLAMEVAARVEKTNLSIVGVAFTTVTQNVDVNKITEDIGHATSRIMRGDKILIILDDVWEKLDLEMLCIPYGNKYKNCKILLASRNKKVCQMMNAQSTICVSPLSTEEAWILFKRVVGERLETDMDLEQVAKKVVEKCGGLPLVINAVGGALRDEDIQGWNRALTQLQKHEPSKINDEEIRKVYAQLKLSYDFLKNEEFKLCFLLCSMFPKGRHIPLEDLVFYMVGLEKFHDLDSMDDARGRVQDAVKNLTSSGLLLISEFEEHTTMHDVIRDVALLIASDGDSKLSIKAQQRLIEWEPSETSLESYTGISLIGNNLTKLHSKVNVPHLKIFLVQDNNDLSMVSDEFIGCLKELMVFDVSRNKISSLPQSFQVMTKLRTLNLSGNRSLCEISILGVLRDLEILILDKTNITKIPIEIAQLVKLRVLLFKYCSYLSHIAHGVITALSRLEELCVDLRWLSEGVTPCIDEVMKLPKLAYLDLMVSSFDLIPNGFNSKNLKGFLIQLGNTDLKYEHMKSDRCLIIASNDLGKPLLKWLKEQIEVSRPHIFLCNTKKLENMMPTLYDEGFNNLGRIELDNCSDVSCLVDVVTRRDGDEGKTKEKFFKELKHLELWFLGNLEVLWKCPDEYISLANLVKLNIDSCGKLKRVFTVGVAKGLVKLKELGIKGCHDLEEVISSSCGGGEDDVSGNVIVFSSLATIHLCGLPLLKRFFNSVGNCSIEYPSLVEVNILICGMEIWGSGIHKTPNLRKLDMNSDVLQVANRSNAINEAMQKHKEKAQMM